MNKRSDIKEASLQRILEAGAARLRQEGLSGTGIIPVMNDAGLTHGTFYTHFANKDDLLVASFRHALDQGRPRWVGRPTEESWPQRLTRLAKRYLTKAHRDDLANSCALSALASEAGHSNEDFRRAYEEELVKMLNAICDENVSPEIAAERMNSAIVFAALCVGGIALARAVPGEELSERILDQCRNAAAHIAALPVPSNQSSLAEETEMDGMPELSQFPHKTYEKMRYVDTDRQGHVNNSVFSSMLETGRIEIFYDPNKPLASENCSFVIANINLDLLAEIIWPGNVDIGTRVSRIGRSSVNIEQALFQDGRCVATAKTVIVHVNNATRRSHPLNEAAIAQLSAFS